MYRKTLSLLKVSAVIAVTIMALVLIQGCSGNSSTQSTGMLKVALTDKPSPDFAAVVVKVKAIKIVPIGFSQDALDNNPSLIDIPIDPLLAPYSFNLLELAYIQKLLGSVILPAGTYSQVRLILEPNPTGQGQDPVNYVILTGDTTNTKIPIKTPSGQQSGLKVLGKFDVKPGVINAIALDFDPTTAIVERGNTQQSDKYILKPTGIRIIQMADVLSVYGSIFGNIAPSSWTTAALTVVPQGQTSPIAAGTLFSSYTTAGLVPFTSNVPADTYRVHIRSDGFLPYSSPLTTVAVKNAYDLGTIILQPLR